MSNSKIVNPSGSELVNMIGGMAGVFPIPARKDNNNENRKAVLS